MARVVGVSRVCGEQQGSYDNKSFAFYGKLWERVENGGDIRKKGKVESVMEFVEKMKKVHEKAVVALRKMQEKMNQYVDRSRREKEE